MMNAQQTTDTSANDARRVRQRADALLAQMTIEEKLGQMNQLFFFGNKAEGPTADGIRKGQVGSLLFVTDPALINSLQRIAVNESRLKIPLIFGYDVTHGFHTIFPVSIVTMRPPPISKVSDLILKLIFSMYYICERC